MKNQIAQNSLKCKINIKKCVCFFWTNLRGGGGGVCRLVQKTNFCPKKIEGSPKADYWKCFNVVGVVAYCLVAEFSKTLLLVKCRSAYGSNC